MIPEQVSQVAGFLDGRVTVPEIAGSNEAVSVIVDRSI
jgi:hypothetical protein